jgi:putative ABC transport system permease protein
VLVNEAFVRKAGLEKPLAHYVDGKQIIGVVKNIHHRPLQHQINPLVISHSDAGWGNRFIYVKTTGEQTEEAINWLRSKWSDIAPATLFEYHFLDDQFNANYRRYYTITNTMQFAGGSTIIIALMGVLGMTLLSVKKREQEISIRKVLGARITNILSLIVRQYLWFILFASIVAAPLAYFGMEYWLQNFAYRITVEYWMFLIPVGALLILTIAIVSLHSVKVASYDPAQTLRYE